jgi:hypothetical protein
MKTFDSYKKELLAFFVKKNKIFWKTNILCVFSLKEENSLSTYYF